MHFEQVIKDCKEPFKELTIIAKNKQIALSLLDFEILNINLYTRSSKKEQFVIADDEFIENIRHKEEFILNPDIELQEKYDIKVFNILNQKNSLSLILTANKSLSVIEATIKKESIIIIDEVLETKLFNELLKAKIRHGLLLSIYYDELKNETIELAKKIRANRGLKEEYKITLCKYFEPQHVVDARLIYRYKEKIKSIGKRDFSKRDFAIGVNSGEIIISYIKPKKGTKGRNCKGEFIPEIDPKVEKGVDFSIDNTIKAVENSDTIDYIAQKSGYVAFENNCYSIKNELEVKELNFRDTGSLVFDKESGIKIRVKGGDPLKESVGENIKVVATEIEIDGNIGQSSTLEAKEITINGQTHASSIISGNEVKINVHKGKLKAKKVSINRLENGEVEAEEVEIETAIGGVIRGKEILIKQLHSIAHIYFSDILEIYSFLGSENRIFATPIAISDISKESQELEEFIKHTEEKIKKDELELAKKSELIHSNISTINELKNKIIAFKSKNQKPPEAISTKLRDFLLVIKHIDDLKKELKETKEKLNSAKKRLLEINNSIFEAKIRVKAKWIGFNEIKFCFLEPPIELIYNPKGHEKEIYLKRDENDKLIVATKD